jgi:hypothetical protein
MSSHSSEHALPHVRVRAHTYRRRRRGWCRKPRQGKTARMANNNTASQASLRMTTRKRMARLQARGRRRVVMMTKREVGLSWPWTPLSARIVPAGFPTRELYCNSSPWVTWADVGSRGKLASGWRCAAGLHLVCRAASRSTSRNL